MPCTRLVAVINNIDFVIDINMSLASIFNIRLPTDTIVTVIVTVIVTILTTVTRVQPTANLVQGFSSVN